MRLLSFDTARAFEAAAGPWLAGEERANNVILSVLKGAARRGDELRGWLVDGGAGPQLALLQTPPQYLLLSEGAIPAAEWAAETLDADLPGSNGPAAVADAFAARWSVRNNRAAFLHSEMTFYSLDRLEPFTQPGGCLRRATLEEVDALTPLAAAAARDMNLPAPERIPAVLETHLRQRLAEGRQFVWEEGSSIRALAAYVDALEHAGTRIVGVYTPPEFRGRGYGTAITGALAETLLAAGQAWVALFADNANSTSTGIYRRLGFRPQLVFRSWRFE
jgi:predicted GNAT family acetyltransferase